MVIMMIMIIILFNGHWPCIQSKAQSILPDDHDDHLKACFAILVAKMTKSMPTVMLQDLPLQTTVSCLKIMMITTIIELLITMLMIRQMLMMLMTMMTVMAKYLPLQTTELSRLSSLDSPHIRALDRSSSLTLGYRDHIQYI